MKMLTLTGIALSKKDIDTFHKKLGKEPEIFIESKFIKNKILKF